MLQFHSTETNRAKLSGASHDQERKVGAVIRHTVGVIAFYRDQLWGKHSRCHHCGSQQPAQGSMDPLHVLPAFTPQVFALADASCPSFSPSSHAWDCTCSHPWPLLLHTGQTPTKSVPPSGGPRSNSGSQFGALQCTVQAWTPCGLS